jgi:hypothetical protein
VRVRKFVVEDSVEEKIVKLQMKKKVSATKDWHSHCTHGKPPDCSLTMHLVRICQLIFWMQMGTDNWRAQSRHWKTLN